MTDQDKQKEIEELSALIASTEKSLEEAKKKFFNLTGEKSHDILGGSPPDLKIYEAGKVIEGIFDGENMIGPDGKVFPVPANYASKSKLVEGDKLKLTVADDGSFIYKQIGPVARKKVIGTLGFENNVYHVLAEGKAYNVLYASVTYFKAKSGDRVTIVVPEKEDATWAALENIIHDVSQISGNKESEGKMPNNSSGISDQPDTNSTGPKMKKEGENYVADSSAKPNTEDSEVSMEDGREALPDGHFLPLDGTDDNEQNAMGEKITDTSAEDNAPDLET